MSFDGLLKNAEHVVPGMQANAWMWDFRQEVEKTHGDAIFYELVLPKDTDADWSAFVETELVKLFDHLEAKKSRPPGDGRLVICVWTETEVHVFPKTAFWDTLADIEGCTPSALVGRAVGWRQARDHRNDPSSTDLPLLPAPK